MAILQAGDIFGDQNLCKIHFYGDIRIGPKGVGLLHFDSTNINRVPYLKEMISERSSGKFEVLDYMVERRYRIKSCI